MRTVGAQKKSYPAAAPSVTNGEVFKRIEEPAWNFAPKTLGLSETGTYVRFIRGIIRKRLVIKRSDLSRR